MKFFLTLFAFSSLVGSTIADAMTAVDVKNDLASDLTKQMSVLHDQMDAVCKATVSSDKTAKFQQYQDTQKIVCQNLVIAAERVKKFNETVTSPMTESDGQELSKSLNDYEKKIFDTTSLIKSNKDNIKTISSDAIDKVEVLVTDLHTAVSGYVKSLLTIVTNSVGESINGTIQIIDSDFDSLLLDLKQQ